MRMLLFAGGAFLHVAALAQATHAAGVTYLSCTLQHNYKPLVVNIAADEANQNVTFELPSTGLVERRSAVFSSDAVSFSMPVAGVATLTYRVSRLDLSITRTTAVNDKVFTDNGTCIVNTAPQRAF